MVQAGFGISFVVNYSIQPSPGYRLIPFSLSPPEPQVNLDLIALWKSKRNDLLAREFVDLSCRIQNDRQAGNGAGGAPILPEIKNR